MDKKKPELRHNFKFLRTAGSLAEAHRLILLTQRSRN